MKTRIAAILPLLLALPSMAQNFDPPTVKTPDAATLRKIEEGAKQLKEAVAAAARGLPELNRADLEIYPKAVDWIVRHQEWFTADSGKHTLAVIDQGLARAKSAAERKTPWLEPAGKSVARGYRSMIDDSVQPYGVIYPVGYGKDPNKKWRLDISLHGRDGSLTEVKHLNQHAGRAAPKDQDYVQLNIYGRGNNAYRWAGEHDVFEAMEHFLLAEARAGRPEAIDLQRVVLKGFSMGGAGTWHLGLRYPDRFTVLQPGAGFTTTHGYVGKLPEVLPDYQEKCLRIYDAYRYAENAFNIPIVAYSGEKDPQKKAADNIEAELKRLKLSDRMVHLIGPNLEHKFPPEWQKSAEAELKKHVGEGKGRSGYPKNVRFVTYSQMSPACDWIFIHAFEKQYEAARVDGAFDGESFTLKTENVRRLTLLASPGKRFPAKVTIDGQVVVSVLDDRPPAGRCDFEKAEGKWISKVRRLSDPIAKEGSVHGPIDDAFTAPFICVIGASKPMHSAMDEAAKAQLNRFVREWNKHFRGELVVKKDTEVTEDESQRKNLILFGDPTSNSWIAKTLPKLPISWDEKSVKFCESEFDASTHLPMLIYPSPHAPNRYIVINSGHTFHDAEFKGTNALLYPRLGDFALVKPAPTKNDPAAFDVITAGLFDENWKFPKK